jgi:hypothetical protein
MEEESITQGCFLRVPKNVKKSKPDSSFTLLLGGKETEQSANAREHAFRVCWDRVCAQIDSVKDNVYQATFDTVASFIKSEINEWHKSGTLDQQGIHKIQAQLPTAVIIAGMNVIDHQSVLQDLKHVIEAEKNSLVVSLDSNDCSNPSNAIFSLVSQFILHKQARKMEYDEKVSRSRCSVRQLLLWYKLFCKYKKLPPGSISMIVILPDFECFSPEVAQLLVSICA